MSSKKDDAPERRKTNAVVPARVKGGNIMAFVYYARVETISLTRLHGHEVTVTNLDNGDKFSVRGDVLISAARSADLFEETVNVTMTKAAEILVTLFNVPFTVCFVKRDGTERILRGRLLAPEPLLGRSHVEDLDLPGNPGDASRIRLVDHRTIRWLIVEGVKYVVK